MGHQKIEYRLGKTSPVIVMYDSSAPMPWRHTLTATRRVPHLKKIDVLQFTLNSDL